jgi:hypothetical protein
MFNAAKDVPGTSPQFRSQVNFFPGYTLFQPRDAALREDTSLQACQTHLPGIREALTYLPDGQQYAQQAGQDLQAIIDGSNQWIEVCEAVIERESRGG